MTRIYITNSILSDHDQSALSRMVQTIRAWISEFRIRRRLRNELANLSNQILRDIGMIRDDVQVSCNWSLSRDAVDELCKIANTRVGNW